MIASFEDWQIRTLIASFLTDKNQTVQLNVSTSDVRSLGYGVPQGSVLGPLLFSIYVSGHYLFLEAGGKLFEDDTSQVGYCFLLCLCCYWHCSFFAIDVSILCRSV